MICKCERCKERIDKSDVKTFSIITIKDIDKPKRVYLCSSCTHGLELYLHGWDLNFNKELKGGKL